jgi:polysaccharide export outer membrane protein
MEDEKVTLAGALGRTGGLDANTADARSVLLFRFERPEVAAALGVTAAPSPKGVPIIYHLNLRDPEGLFIAQQFEVRADDVIYVPRAGVAEARQFIDLVAAASSIAYNVRVTSVVP